MKKSMRMITAVLAFFLMVLLAGCGGSDGNNQGSVPAGQKDISSGQTANAAKPDDGGSGGDSFQVGEDLTWPAQFMGDLPQPQGKISAVIKDDGSQQYTVTCDGMDQEAAQAYAAQIKALGYQGGLEMSDGDMIMLSGIVETGAEASFIYTVSNKEAIITYDPHAEEASMEDAIAWPEGFLRGVPELAGKITDVVNDNDRLVTVYLEKVEKADFKAYIEQLKQAGYTVDADQSSSVSNIDYRGYNAAGDWVNASLDMEEGGNQARVEMEKRTEEES